MGRSVPEPFHVDDVRASVRKSRGCRDGRWYWRAVSGSRKDLLNVWSGWATRTEAIVEVARRAQGATQIEEFPTVGDLLAAYVWHVENRRDDLAPRSRASFRVACEHLAGSLGSVRPDTLGRRELDHYVHHRRRQNMAPRTIQRELRILSGAWNWARRQGHLDRPAIQLPRLKAKGFVYNHRTPTEVEALAALAKLEGRRAAWAHPVALALFDTGARIGEVSALSVEQPDLHRGLLVVDGKTGARWVPVGSALQAALAAWSGANEHGFWGIRPDGVRVRINDQLAWATRQASVPRFTAHGLRRLAVDRLARAGVDVATAASFMGHSPAVMLGFYRRVQERDLRDARSRLDGALEQLLQDDVGPDVGPAGPKLGESQ